MKLLPFFFATLIALPSAFAGHTTLIVGIDKEGVLAQDIEAAVADLNHRDATMGLCFVESTVISYTESTMIKFASTDKGRFHGVALVDFRWKCDDYARRFLMAWEQSRRYTLSGIPGDLMFSSKGRNR